MHQLISLVGTLLKEDRRAIRSLASHPPIGQKSMGSPIREGTKRHRKQETPMLHTGWYRSSQILSSSTKLNLEQREFHTLPMPMEKLYPRLLENGLIWLVFWREIPNHFSKVDDSSKQCEFHFGKPGHSLEDCHVLKHKIQDLVDHGILRIDEDSTPSVIIAWPPKHRKDKVKDGPSIPSPKSQRPNICGPIHLFTLLTLWEARKPTVPKVWLKLTSKFCNLDDQCSSDKEKADYLTNKCTTLKQKIQELGHLEQDVPAMVQARKPKVKSTLSSHTHEPSRD